MKHGNTFTKKDIIVVLVCIIFLLANIAAINEGGRMRAKQAVCLSNLYKWGQIFQAYTADNDGFFHSRPGTGAIASYKRYWIYVYKPYYNDSIMRFCPAAEDASHIGGPTGVWDWRYVPYNPVNDKTLWVQGENGPPSGSYAMNRWIEDLQGPYATDPGYWRRVGVKDGAQVPLFYDAQSIMTWYRPDAQPPAYDGDWTVGDTQAAACIDRHGGGFINCLLLDFSARKVGLKELWTLKGSRTMDTCGPWTTCGGVQPNDWPEWMRDFKDY